jgi:crotonobetainyl-CoA:carnitine CoA-transferase CaiB-like acyl-CoA transferase
MLGFPLRFAAGECGIRHPSPTLGEHNDEVFASVGLTPEEIADLRARKVI